jgi:hypothetical protein
VGGELEIRPASEQPFFFREKHDLAVKVTVTFPSLLPMLT